MRAAFSLLTERLQHSLLIAVTLAYLLGQVCAVWGWHVLSPAWLIVWVLAVGVSWFISGSKVALSIGGIVSVFLLAAVAVRGVLSPQLPSQHLRHLDLPQKVIVEGWLFREPERLPNRGRLYLEALRVWRDGKPHPASGKILLTVRFLSGPWHYGDVLRMPLRLRATRNFHTPGSFDYEGYLARQGVYLSAFLWDDTLIKQTGARGNALRLYIERLRRTISAFFSARLDKQSAAVLRALIVGDKDGLDKDLREVFARAGVAHVLAISGLHVGLVAITVYSLWWWLLGRSRFLLLTCPMPKLAALLTIPPVLFYAGLAGGSVSTWRAVVMVLVYLVAILIDRRHEVYRSLALAALLISIIWPGAVLDISFQLSFLSVLAIFLGMTRISQWWTTMSERRLLRLSPFSGHVLRVAATYVAVSACAIIGTAPVAAAHFNQVAVAGLFANLLVVPMLGSAAVLLGLAAAVLVFLHTGVASVVLFCAGLATRLGIWLVEWIAAWPYAAIDLVTPSLLELVLFYGLLACLIFQVPSSKPQVSNPRRPTLDLQSVAPVKYLSVILALVILVDGTFWVWQRYFHRDLRVTFLDVGQGDATVVELPGSQVMVIDGGGFAGTDFDSGEAIVAPFLWSRKIMHVDIVVLSHPQLDHYGGLTFVIEHFSPREFWYNGQHAQSPRFTRLLAALQSRGVTVRVLCRGEPERALSNVRVQVLHPPCSRNRLDTNNASLVLRLTHGEVDFVFTGDIEKAGEEMLLAEHESLASEIVKVPHHGSRSSSTPAFVAAIAPQLAVASLGVHNRFRFPDPEVVRRYEERESRILRTDQTGAITITSNGQRYEVKTVIVPDDGVLSQRQE